MRIEITVLQDELQKLKVEIWRLTFLMEAASASLGIASDVDLMYCYRLFLHRPCSPEELADWKSHPRKFSLVELTHRMFSHPEHLALREKYNSPIQVDLDGFQLFVRSDDFLVGQFIAQHKTWEPHVVAALKLILKSGCVFVDVGANVGYLSMLAATIVGESGKVHAFEPNPANCEMLALSVAANGFSQVEIHPLAVSDQESVLTLHTDTSSSLGLLLPKSQTIPALWKVCYPKSVDENGADKKLEHQVRAAPLDELLASTPRIDVVKIDTDGHEPKVLIGMRRILVEHRPALLVEFFPLGYQTFGGRQADAFLHDLRDLDYVIYNLNALNPFTPQSNEELMAAIRGPGDFVDLMALPNGFDLQPSSVSVHASP
jgi:FkbM family methyltransferase